MKKCKSGYYYCNTDKKCKPIPRGYRVGYGGYLRKEKDDDDSKSKSNGNGNGNGNGSHGNGNGGNGSGGNGGGGNGGGMGEEITYEAKMTEKEKKKREEIVMSMKKKKKDFEDRYGEDGKSVMYATATKLAMGEGSLRKWFKGSKSKDGKGGWVNVVTGGTCASDEPGEGTPKCVSSSKRASMTKAERLSAARRKKKADPGQQSKSGAAKPTYVSTDSPRKKKKMKESKDLTTIAKELDKASKMHKSQANRVRKHIKDMHKEEKQPKNCGCGKDPCITYGKKKKKKSHDCASKVEHKQYGVGDCIKEMHTLDSTGNVTHYDVMFEHGIEKNVFVGDLNVLVSEMHEHVINTDKNKELLEMEEEKRKYPNPVNLKKLVDKVNKNPLNKNLGVKKIDVDTDVKTEAKIDTVDPKNKRKRRNEREFGKQTKPYDPDTKEMKTSMGKFMNSMRHDKHNKKRGVKTKGMGEEVVLEADKKGKGSGTKDACYHKVKSRYSVWPSAYASGALVKCRKAGAKNWGNSSKKEEFDYYQMPMKSFDDMVGECWKTHKKVGMKMKGGKMVPDCRPKNEEKEVKEGAPYTVNVADKVGNTPAYQNFKKGMKNKLTGDPLYKAGVGLTKAHFNWKGKMIEAVKHPKLDVKETGVKNKIEINPEIKTEAAKAPVKK